MENLKLLRVEGIALDSFFEDCPDNKYDPCPCGCGEKFKFVIQDDVKLKTHQLKYIKNLMLRTIAKTFS